MPRSRPARFVALAAALLLGGGVLGSAIPAAAATSAAPAAAGHHRTSVWLPTGEVVSYDPAHPTNLRVRTRTASGPGHAWRALQRKGHIYVFPIAASPFLGTVLDPSLFDVTALAAAKASPTVHVTNAGTAPASIPGFTRTGSGTGHFTHAGARTFGVALLKAAATAGRSATAVRTLFGASSISAATTGPVTPHFQQQTVIFKAVGADGKPLPEGFMFYGNLDDAARATDFAVIVDGEVRVSLPAGHYTLASEADTVTQTSSDSRIVTAPNLTITGAKNQVVRLDFRTATAEPSVTLPRPTTPQDFVLDYERAWPTSGFGALLFGDETVTVRFAPAPAPTIGTASLSSFFTAVGSTGSEYDTYFVRNGAIPADLHDRVSRGQLASIRERVFDNGASATTFFGHGVTNPDGSGIGIGRTVTLPLDRTDYLYATPGVLWNDTVALESLNTQNPIAGEVDGSPYAVAPGSHRTADWLRQAIAPQVPRASAFEIAQGIGCPACRVNGELFVAVSPFQDTAKTGHFGFLYDETSGELAARTRLYRNGTLLDDERGANFVDSAVPAGRATYRVLAESTPVSAGFRLGTIASTDWTFRSAAGSGGALPKGWSCSLPGSGCRILPLLQVRAPLPTDLRGNIGVGAHRVHLVVAPIQGAPASGTTANVQLSFDGGRTWTGQPVRADGRNTFSVTLTNPASSVGIRPTLRITGSDTAGDTVVQTVTAAYRVSTR